MSTIGNPGTGPLTVVQAAQLAKQGLARAPGEPTAVDGPGIAPDVVVAAGTGMLTAGRKVLLAGLKVPDLPEAVPAQPSPEALARQDLVAKVRALGKGSGAVASWASGVEMGGPCLPLPADLPFTAARRERVEGPGRTMDGAASVVDAMYRDLITSQRAGAMFPAGEVPVDVAAWQQHVEAGGPYWPVPKGLPVTGARQAIIDRVARRYAPDDPPPDVQRWLADVATGGPMLPLPPSLSQWTLDSYDFKIELMVMIMKALEILNGDERAHVRRKADEVRAMALAPMPNGQDINARIEALLSYLEGQQATG